MRTTKQEAISLTQPTASRYFVQPSVVQILTLHHSQDGSSEEFIGEWAEARGIRDQLVIATKVR
jgi:hypothetical protein